MNTRTAKLPSSDRLTTQKCEPTIASRNFVEDTLLRSRNFEFSWAFMLLAYIRLMSSKDYEDHPGFLCSEEKLFDSIKGEPTYFASSPTLLRSIMTSDEVDRDSTTSKNKKTLETRSLLLFAVIPHACTGSWKSTTART